MEVIGRVESGTETESNAGAVAEDVMYVAGAWMHRSDDLRNVMAEYCSCIFCTSATPLKGVPRSMAVVCRGEARER